ncbi:hypothetical protein ES319_A05G164200v1 [Gossypium barbadense]|uniref:Uncharacterized protein n=1 Tax=Gossypium barbadense TaxID=3634 RepID=A0A5J5VQJ5_GOSBA|nr:hypothetical protein ES319_A05G164200v1 [Gossypium barbadense]
MLMAALSISENDNKETISPFSSKTPLSLLPKSSSSIIKKPRPRKPLQDITNLLLPQISSSLPPPNAANLVSPQALVYQPQWRKRRAGDGHQSNCMKSRFVYKLHCLHSFLNYFISLTEFSFFNLFIHLLMDYITNNITVLCFVPCFRIDTLMRKEYS